jgi:ribosomal protein S18 acetylase RimI-like enzyme
MQVTIRPLAPADGDWAHDLLVRSWGDVHVVSRGARHEASKLPGFVAEADGERVGLCTYRITGTDCEVVTIDAVMPRRRIGSALMSAVVGVAETNGCQRVWLITTNDNIDALQFYVRCGMRLVHVHLDALEQSRALKPSIPARGKGGLPLRDEWELELTL